MLSRGIARNGSRKSEVARFGSSTATVHPRSGASGSGGGGGGGGGVGREGGTPLLGLSLNNAWF